MSHARLLGYIYTSSQHDDESAAKRRDIATDPPPVLTHNCLVISDDGCTALAEACASGALPNLQNLILIRNNIGAAGVKSFELACTSGALPLLKTLIVGVRPKKRGEAFKKRGIKLR